MHKNLRSLPRTICGLLNQQCNKGTVKDQSPDSLIDNREISELYLVWLHYTVVDDYTAKHEYDMEIKMLLWSDTLLWLSQIRGRVLGGGLKCRNDGNSVVNNSRYLFKKKKSFLSCTWNYFNIFIWEHVLCVTSNEEACHSSHWKHIVMMKAHLESNSI